MVTLQLLTGYTLALLAVAALPYLLFFGPSNLIGLTIMIAACGTLIAIDAQKEMKGL